MKWTIPLMTALTVSACNMGAAASDPAVERMKQQVLIMLRDHRSAEFADIQPCPAGQGYSGTVRAGDGNGGTSGPFPFIVVGDLVAIDQDSTPAEQRIQAGSYESSMGRYAALRPRCFGGGSGGGNTL